MELDPQLSRQIQRLGQGQILQYWNDLTAAEQASFVQQLQLLDWSLVESFTPEMDTCSNSSKQMIPVVAPPAHVVRLPKSDQDHQRLVQARRLGEEALSNGRVAAVLLAGGQGTRLGFNHPKGVFPIGPVSEHSLFQILAEKVVALTRHYGHAIPYLVMTSENTHDETISFFQRHNWFGLIRNDLYFFQQGLAPSLNLKTGKLMLAGRSSLCLNPDGHGGLLAAMSRNGLFDVLRDRCIDYLFTHQIDNPLAKVCDPEFIGLHRLFQSQVSTKVVSKLDPSEKVGVAVELDGHTSIIEYSDLPVELANQYDADGGLTYWAGSTAIHLFDRSFLEQVATSQKSLPWHRAIKKIPCLNPHGQPVQPEQENGVKFERFLFDTLPLAKTALIVETSRPDEFAPLKNSDGDFSATDVRQRMVQVAIRWLNLSGLAVSDKATVEISPLVALSADDLVARREELLSTQWNRPVYLGPVDKTTVELPSANSAISLASTGVHDPLVFDAFYRPQVWGGRALHSLLKRPLPQDGPYGEAWDLSTHKLHVSRVIEGPLAGYDLNELWQNYHSLLAGDAQGGPFPLLIKWLECRELLSVQVHPDDEMAQRVLQEPFGKSEAWVVIAAEPTARIYAGLKPGVAQRDVLDHIKAGTLANCLHSFTPAAGDCLWLPAGTIHAAGGGLVLAEIQQSSDATFRLFDWNRLGLDGRPRTLQVDLAVEAVNWNQGPVSPVTPNSFSINQPGVRAEKLVDSPVFRLERYFITQSMSAPHTGEMTIWMVLDGKGELLHPTSGYYRPIQQGDTVLIPAASQGAVWRIADTKQPLALMCARLHRQ